MNLVTLLRAAAIIGACVWALFLIMGWSAYTDMQAFRGGMYAKVIEDAFQSLLIQSIIAFLLLMGGIFLKGSPSQEVADEYDAKEPSDFSKQVNLIFTGEPVLENDSYKIFLTSKYSIQKNDVLGKYILQEKLFDSIDDALTFAATSEKTIKDDAEKKEQLQKAQKEKERQIEENYLKSPEHKKKRKFELIGAFIFFAILVYLFISFNSGKSQKPQPKSPAANAQSKEKLSLAIDQNKSYSKLREEIISSGWSIYKRSNVIKGWDKNREYPELDFCSEDYCVASFISSDGTKVREVGFGYCSTDSYIQCPNKPSGFKVVRNDVVISKNESDIKFLQVKRRFED